MGFISDGIDGLFEDLLDHDPTEAEYRTPSTAAESAADETLTGVFTKDETAELLQDNQGKRVPQTGTLWLEAGTDTALEALCEETEDWTQGKIRIDNENWNIKTATKDKQGRTVLTLILPGTKTLRRVNNRI